MDNKLKENVLVFEKDGKEIECQILFTCNLEGYEGNNYVVFQIGDSEDISAARYTEEGAGIGELMDIETDKEWKIIETILEEMQNEVEEA